MHVSVKSYSLSSGLPPYWDRAENEQGARQTRMAPDSVVDRSPHGYVVPVYGNCVVVLTRSSLEEEQVSVL